MHILEALNNNNQHKMSINIAQAHRLMSRSSNHTRNSNLELLWVLLLIPIPTYRTLTTDLSSIVITCIAVVLKPRT